MSQSPSFNFTATGAGKETTTGVPVTPTVWFSTQDITMTATNSMLERNSARNQVGTEDSLTGPLGGAGSFTIESDADIIGTPLAWAMGTESVAINPGAGNPAANAQVDATISALANPGDTTISLSSAANVVAGMALVLDALGSATEIVTVASVAGTLVTLTAPLLYQHVVGAVVNAHTAYDHTLLLGIPRPTFTVQFNRKTDVVSYYGNKVSDWTLALNPRQLVAIGFRTIYVSEGTSVAGTPAFSRIKPFRVLDPLNTLTINGQLAPTNILSMNIAVNNGLQGTEYFIGGGRLISSIPEGQTRVTGSMTIQFTSDYFQQLFWGSIGAQGPQSTVVGATMVFTILSPSYVNGTIRYGMVLTLNNVKLSTAPTAGRSGSVLQQTVNFMAAQSAPNANDDIKIVATNAMAVAA